jgi:ribosomal protein S18 acetylase RimI-like enzyme
MEIRRLLPEDAAAFQTIRLHGLLECPSAFSSSHPEEVETPLATIAGRLEPKPDGAVFGCFVNADLVGVIGVQREVRVKLAHKAFIWGMYVIPSYRRRGVGRNLVSRAMEYAAKELNVLSVNLGVNTENGPALALYEAMGFKTYGTEIGFLRVDGVLHDEYLMAWTRVGAA